MATREQVAPAHADSITVAQYLTQGRTSFLAMSVERVLLQAEAFPVLCSMLSLARGLRALRLELRGVAAVAVPPRLGELSSLTQLDRLQLLRVAVDMEAELLSAALSPLTQLTLLRLRFDTGHWDPAGQRTAFPWEDLSVLTNLRVLHITSALEYSGRSEDMFQGSLPAALSQLKHLSYLEVRGMKELAALDDSNQLQLAALPNLTLADLELQTEAGKYPTLTDERVMLSRIVSLRLDRRVNVSRHEPYADMLLPAIFAPALESLELDDIKLAPGSEELSWLPYLPKLRRLVLTDVKTASSQIPLGIVSCSGLTELTLKRYLVSFTNTHVDPRNRPECRLRGLPAAGPYVSKLVRFSLRGNALSVVPPALAGATALELLDISGQRRSGENDQLVGAVRGLSVLNNMVRLHLVDLTGFSTGADSIRRFQAANPSVRVIV